MAESILAGAPATPDPLPAFLTAERIELARDASLEAEALIDALLELSVKGRSDDEARLGAKVRAFALRLRTLNEASMCALDDGATTQEDLEAMVEVRHG
jgi:hypothetical protein